MFNNPAQQQMGAGGTNLVPQLIYVPVAGGMQQAFNTIGNFTGFGSMPTATGFAAPGGWGQPANAGFFSGFAGQFASAGGFNSGLYDPVANIGGEVFGGAAPSYAQTSPVFYQAPSAVPPQSSSVFFQPPVAPPVQMFPGFSPAASVPMSLPVTNFNVTAPRTTVSTSVDTSQTSANLVNMFGMASSVLMMQILKNAITESGDRESRATSSSTRLRSYIEDVRREYEGEIDIIRDRHKREINNLRDDIDELRNDHKKEIDDIKRDSQKDLNDLDAKRKKELEDLKKKQEDEIKSLNEAHQRQISTINKDNQEKLDKVKAEHEAEIAKINTRHQKEVDDLKARHQQQIDDLNHRISDINARHAQEVDALNSQKRALEADNTRLTELNARKDQEIADLNAQYDRDVAALQAQNLSLEQRNARLTELNAQKDAQLAALNARYQADIEALTAQNQALRDINTQLNQLNTQKDQQIASLNTQISTLRTQHQAEITRLQTENQQALQRLGAQKDQEIATIRNAYEAQIAQLRNQHQAQVSQLQTQVNNLTAEIANVRAQLATNFANGKENLISAVNEFLSSQYFGDTQLAGLVNNPQSHWTTINKAHDGQANLVNPNRYRLAELRAAYPDLGTILPTSPYSTSHPNKNFLLGEAQNTLDLINILKRHKQQYGVSADPQIDTLINQLNTRARNYIRATHNLGSPIAFDLNNDGKIGTRAAGSSNFDLNADGIKDQTSWLDSNDGFLVLDRNGNGTIDDGRELFGDQHGADNGFKELAKFDENGDGVIDNKDSVFSKLKVWVDSNGDGVSQANELKTLAEWGINSVDLAYSTDGRFIDENDVDHREIGSFTINGQKRLAVDVWFALGQG